MRDRIKALLQSLAIIVSAFVAVFMLTRAAAAEAYGDAD